MDRQQNNRTRPLYPVFDGLKVAWREVNRPTPDNRTHTAKERERAVRIRSAFAQLTGKQLDLPDIPEMPEDAPSVADLAVLMAVLEDHGYIQFHMPRASHYVGEVTLVGNVVTARGTYTALRSAAFEGVTTLTAANAKQQAAYALEDAPHDSHIFGIQSIGEAYDDSHTEFFASDIIREPPPTRQAINPVLVERIRQHIIRASKVLVIAPVGSGVLNDTTVATISTPPDRNDLRTLAAILSLSGLEIAKMPINRPFRAPHNAVSEQGMRGAKQRPGELSLAYGGVLVLHGVNEFRRLVLGAVFEAHKYARAGVIGMASADFPVSCAIVGIATPCPCGVYGNPKLKCGCTYSMREKWLERIPAPKFDEVIDMTGAW